MYGESGCIHHHQCPLLLLAVIHPRHAGYTHATLRLMGRHAGYTQATLRIMGRHAGYTQATLRLMGRHAGYTTRLNERYVLEGIQTTVYLKPHITTIRFGVI